MSIIEGARTHWRLFGIGGIVSIARARLTRRPLQITVTSTLHHQPVHLRMRTTDVSVYEEIIVNAEYRMEVDDEPAVIVDAGANIGLTSVYFANRYPRARVIAIEPEASNFAMLVKNTQPYPRIVALQAALWRSDTRLDLHDPGTGNWGFQTGEAATGHEDGRVRGLTIDTLMRETGVDHIDILKVDIEGAEKEVFEAGGDWIDKVDLLVVELHDRWKQGCSEAVHRAAAKFPVWHTRGETTFFHRSPPAPRMDARRVDREGGGQAARARIVATTSRHGAQGLPERVARRSVR